MTDLAVVGQPGALEQASSRQVLDWCERGREALDNATSLTDAKGILNVADTLAHAVSLRDMNTETIIAASRLKLLAERRVGELIGIERQAERLASNGGRRHLQPVSLVGNETDPEPLRPLATLADHGITYDEASAFTKLADVPADVFNKRLDEAAADAADKRIGITRTNILRRINPEAEKRPAERAADFERFVDACDRANRLATAALATIRFHRDAVATPEWPDLSTNYARRTLSALTATLATITKEINR